MRSEFHSSGEQVALIPLGWYSHGNYFLIQILGQIYFYHENNLVYKYLDQKKMYRSKNKELV